MKDEYMLDNISDFQSHLDNIISQKSILDQGLILGLEGELGVGKTTFIQQLLLSLGYTEPVHSPTFGKIHEYTLSDSHIIYHIDLYRELIDEDLINDLFLHYKAGDMIIIEWVNLLSEDILSYIQSYMPYIYLHISYIDDHRRIMNIREYNATKDL